MFHRYNDNGEIVAHGGNNVDWQVKKKLRDYYTKATETKVDINNVRHEQENKLEKS